LIYNDVEKVAGLSPACFLLLLANKF
jgi:hypothetical protein